MQVVIFPCLLISQLLYSWSKCHVPDHLIGPASWWGTIFFFFHLETTQKHFEIPRTFWYDIRIDGFYTFQNSLNLLICIVSKSLWHFPFWKFLQLFQFQDFYNILSNVRLGPKKGILSHFRDFFQGMKTWAFLSNFISCSCLYENHEILTRM